MKCVAMKRRNRLAIKNEASRKVLQEKMKLPFARKTKKGSCWEEVHSKCGHEELKGHKEVKKCVATNSM